MSKSHSEVTMENLLTCPICFEHLNTALMITQCSHNFCALCIRKYLTYQNKCPVCNINAVESDLKNNRLVDNILEQYLQLRKKTEHSTATQGVSVEHVTAQSKLTFTILRNRNKNAGGTSSPSSRPESSKDEVINISDDDGQKKVNDATVVRDRMKKDLQNRCRLKSQQTRTAEAETNKTFDEDIEVTSSTTPCSPQPGPANDEVDGTIFSPPGNSNDEKVTCPVCGIAVKQQNVNMHLDSCLTSVEKKSALRRPTPKRKPMAKLVYNIISEKDLRKKLIEIGLNSKGDKQTLVKRHREFMIMYNAECDSLTPKPVVDIIKEVERMEKAKEEKGSIFSRTKRLTLNKNSSPDSIDKAQKSYVKHHKSQFNSLVAQAKKSRMKHRSAKRDLVTDGADTTGEVSSAVRNFMDESMESSSKQIDRPESSFQTKGVSAVKDDNFIKNNSLENKTKNEENISSTKTAELSIARVDMSHTASSVIQDLTDIHKSAAEMCGNNSPMSQGNNYKSAAEMCDNNSPMSQENTDGKDSDADLHSESNICYKTRKNSSRPRSSQPAFIVNSDYDAVERKSLRSLESSKTRFVGDSSVSDTDRCVEDGSEKLKSGNGVDVTDRLADITERGLETSSLEKALRGKKQTKSAKQSERSHVQKSYENGICNIGDDVDEGIEVFQANSRHTRSKSRKMEDRKLANKMEQNKKDNIVKKLEEKEKQTVEHKTNIPGSCNTRRSSRRSLSFPKQSENDSKSDDKDTKLCESHVESSKNVKSLRKVAKASEKNIISSEKLVTEKIPVSSKQKTSRPRKKNTGNGDPTGNEEVRNLNGDVKLTKDTNFEENTQDSSLILNKTSNIRNQEDTLIGIQKNDWIYSSDFDSDEDENRSLADLKAVLDEKTNNHISETINQALVDISGKGHTHEEIRAQKSDSKKADAKNKSDVKFESVIANSNSKSQNDNKEIIDAGSSSDECVVKQSSLSKQTSSIIGKENILHSSPVVAGLHCSPLRSLKKSVLPSPKSPHQHLFVDDSESECGSCDGLLDKVNRVIDKFSDDPKVDGDSLLNTYTVTDEWPALSQTTEKAETVCPTRNRHVSGVSDISGLSTTDSFTSLDSDVSSVLPTLDNSVSVEIIARRSLDSSVCRKDNNLTEPRRSKRKRESSLTELPSRSKRQRK